MPTTRGLGRLWRVLASFWRRGPALFRAPIPAVGSDQAPSAPESPRGHDDARSGEPLTGGTVTLRMWVVAGRLVLATSAAEAERAVVALVGQLDRDGQDAARVLLDHWRGDRVAAA